MAIPEFEVEMNSEVANFLNFFVCELIIMAYVIYATTTVAGAINFVHARGGTKLDLRPFDFPHLGGGLIMARSNARLALVALRALTLAAIAISSFGLEGRTRTKMSLQMVTIRRPGRSDVRNSIEFARRTELYRRCFRTTDEYITYGAVLDDRCYPNINPPHVAIVVRSLSVRSQKFLASAVNCSSVVHRNFNNIIYFCKDMDIACKGTDPLHTQHGRCSSVIYNGTTGAWVCPVKSARPNIMNEPVSCQYMDADRKDIRLWTETSAIRPNDLKASIFSAAYAVPERRRMDVPVGERAVTIVTIFWMIPAVVQVAIVIVISVWGISLKMRGAARVANDERGLLAVLQQRVDLGTVRLAEWMHNENSNSGSTAHLTPEQEDDV